MGGTSEGRRLAQRLATDARYQALLSFAGRTQRLEDPRVPYRVGGFGGVEGLSAYLQAERWDALVDATHPFAAQMSRHAARAAELTQTPLLRVEWPAWSPVEGDRWIAVADMVEAAVALGLAPRRVFLSIGRLELGAFRAAPQHEYLIRMLDELTVDLPRARVLAARGPFDAEAEASLLEREGIEVIVSKNSGTAATYGKLAAARRLGLPVVMVERPRLPPVESAGTCEAAYAWLAALQEAAHQEAAHHGASLTRRGV